MEYSVLGPLEVRSDGQTIPIGSAKQRAVLAVLALEAGRVVPVERLIDELWGDSPPATATTALQVYVSKLRKTLGDRAIETRSPGYLLRCSPDELDLRRFERLTAEARDAEPERAAALLGEALALWRGSALADVDLPLESARLEELRLGAQEQRIDADLARGRSAELVGELEALVSAHPLREPFRAQLMLALYRAGRQAEALEAYRDARAALVEQLGIEPSQRLQQLEQAILRQDATLTGAAAAKKTVAATALFLDLGVQGEIEVVVDRAVATAVGELGRTADRVERGLADAVLAVFVDADEAVSAASAVVQRLQSDFGASVAPRAGLATADVTLAERASGAAPVLAARQVRIAKPGEVVVGSRTAAAATAHRFRRRGNCFVVV
jgi:DNA-binding SARP family transcriptional activator